MRNPGGKSGWRGLKFSDGERSAAEKQLPLFVQLDFADDNILHNI